MQRNQNNMQQLNVNDRLPQNMAMLGQLNQNNKFILNVKQCKFI